MWNKTQVALKYAFQPKNTPNFEITLAFHSKDQNLFSKLNVNCGCL
jgi:hypothetical protein